jgi:hypothetical protein
VGAALSAGKLRQHCTPVLLQVCHVCALAAAAMLRFFSAVAPPLCVCVLNTRHLRVPSHRNSQHVVCKMGCSNPGRNVQQTKIQLENLHLIGVTQPTVVPSVLLLCVCVCACVRACVCVCVQAAERYISYLPGQ